MTTSNCRENSDTEKREKNGKHLGDELSPWQQRQTSRWCRSGRKHRTATLPSSGPRYPSRGLHQAGSRNLCSHVCRKEKRNSKSPMRPAMKQNRRVAIKGNRNHEKTRDGSRTWQRRSSETRIAAHIWPRFPLRGLTSGKTRALIAGSGRRRRKNGFSMKDAIFEGSMQISPLSCVSEIR